MERNTFLFYRSYAEVLEDLSDEEAGKLYKAISKYALDGVEQPLEGYLAGYFRLIKPQLDANKTKYENGSKGGRPRKKEKTEIKPNKNRIETEPEPNESETEAPQNPMINDKCIMLNDKGVMGNDKNQKRRFTPPTLEQLKEFIKNNNLNIDPERFLDYYESNGWKVGKNPMKDWQATARNWSRKDKKAEKQEDDDLEHLLEIEKIARRAT